MRDVHKMSCSMCKLIIMPVSLSLQLKGVWHLQRRLVLKTFGRKSCQFLCLRLEVAYLGLSQADWDPRVAWMKREICRSLGRTGRMCPLKSYARTVWSVMSSHFKNTEDNPMRTLEISHPGRFFLKSSLPKTESWFCFICSCINHARRRWVC